MVEYFMLILSLGGELDCQILNQLKKELKL
jgi:hypothetical protein